MILDEKIQILYVFNFTRENFKLALERFLCSIKSIQNQNLEICVSNNSEECIFSEIKNLNISRYIHTPNPSKFSRAWSINFAAKKLIDQDYFYMSDIDLVYSPNHFERLKIKLNQINLREKPIRYVPYNYNLLPKRGSFSNRVINRIGFLKKFHSIVHEYSWDYLYLDTLMKEPGGFAHGNGLIHFNSFLQIQGFDEDFIGYGPEDKLFNKRIGFINNVIFDNLNDTSTFHLWHLPLSRFQEVENMNYYTASLDYLNLLDNPSVKDIMANKNCSGWGIL